MKRSAKIMMAVLSLVLVVSLSVGGTLAYLKASSGPVENTFTFGNLDVTLAETTGSTYQVIPGKDITKDPLVTLTNKPGYDDVDAYVYIRVQEQNWPAATEDRPDGSLRKVRYDLADGWEKLSGVDNVYCRKVLKGDRVKSFPVLQDNRITVSGDLTKEELKAASSARLILTAYAVQADGMTDAKDAWVKAGF